MEFKIDDLITEILAAAKGYLTRQLEKGLSGS